MPQPTLLLVQAPKPATLVLASEPASVESVADHEALLHRGDSLTARFTGMTNWHYAITLMLGGKLACASFQSAAAPNEGPGS